jgi:transcriptional regulator with PAS, ATPase and Fis domain
MQVKALAELAEPAIKIMKNLLSEEAIILILDENGTILSGRSKLFEHDPFLTSNHNLISQASTIYDPEGGIIGYIKILNVDDSDENLRHLLDFSVAAIEGEYSRQLTQLLHSQLLATLESIPVGVFILNDSMHITRVNVAMQKLLGINSDVMIGKHIDYYLNSKGFFDKLLINKASVFDKEMSFTTFKGKMTCGVSVSLIKGIDGTYQGMVIKLKSTKYMYRFLDTSKDSRAVYRFENIIGESKEIKKAIRISQVAAKSNSSVLLIGGTGTGKELFAQAIHNASPRKNKPFIAINCGSFPRGLIESELFGYEGGAFTGAKKDGQPGKFEMAEGGTLFLDEIGDMPIDLQVNLLRVLQNKEIVRVGGTRVIKVDVRIIVATNKNVEQSIMDNTFRSDLYYRLNVFSINIPPLKDRKEDLLLLSDYFIGKFAHSLSMKRKVLDDQVIEIFKRHDWPGNIRELENAIERAMNLSETDIITVEDIPEYMKNVLHSMHRRDSENSLEEPSGPGKIEKAEKDIIIDALINCEGNLTEAAAEIGISRRALYRRLEKYNIYASLYRGNGK